MPFQPGHDVVVRSLNRRGRIVDVLGHRYRVAVGAMVIVAAEDDLKSLEGARKASAGQKPRESRRRKDVSPAEAGRKSERSAAAHARHVDLHGMTTEAAREAVLKAVNDAILAGDEVLEVMHGLGTGRVRAAVWRELSRLSVVRHLRPHPTNPGVTIVQL